MTNVAAGTADTDAANVGQMNEGDARTLNDARAYTDAASSPISSPRRCRPSTTCAAR